MSLEPQGISEGIPEASLGSLSGCLVDGDAEQRRRGRRTRRRALAISILLQSAVLAALILVPLFGKAEHIALTIVTPIPPYSRYQHATRASGGTTRPSTGKRDVCRFCPPPNIPPTIAMRDQPSRGNETDENPFEGQGPNIPGADGLIPLSGARQRGPEREQIEKRSERPRIVHVTHLDPAMLVHRVEPVYPPLARQTRREGRVELRAIIGIDGTIQSLQIVASDPLFDLSAREAVRQWRYRPTILNGQPVEIDTYITVIYTTQH